MNQHIFISTSIGFILGLCGTWAAAQSPAPEQQNSTPASAAMTTLTPHQQAAWVSVQVMDVNMPERILTVRTADGVLDLHVRDVIKRLEDIHIGDVLDVRYELALGISAIQTEGGIRSRTTAQSTQRRAEGLPAGEGYIAEIIVADVLAIDTQRSAIHIRGPKRAEWVRILDADLIKKLKVGDQIEIKYRLAAAIEFSAATSRK